MSTFLESSKRPAVKVFVATTVMLTFISFWRAAAIVLDELAGGVADQALVVGKQTIECDEINPAEFDGRHELITSREIGRMRENFLE